MHVSYLRKISLPYSTQSCLAQELGSAVLYPDSKLRPQGALRTPHFLVSTSCRALEERTAASVSFPRQPNRRVGAHRHRSLIGIVLESIRSLCSRLIQDYALTDDGVVLLIRHSIVQRDCLMLVLEPG